MEQPAQLKGSGGPLLNYPSRPNVDEAGDLGSGQLGLPTVNGINLNDFVSARASPTMQDGRVSLNYRF